MNRGFIGALSLSVVFAMLAGCGGSQPPIGTLGGAPGGAPGVVPTSRSEERYRQIFAFGMPSGRCPDGAFPVGRLLALDGMLYGTTFGGGENGGGTIFTMTKQGVEHVIYSFTGMNKYGGYGGGPEAGVVVANRTLYGTTVIDGDNDAGTVFAVNVSGTHFRTLHSFGAAGDGSAPQANLIFHAETLYGTTTQGGASNIGTVFSVNARSGAERLLHAFAGAPGDGREPQADLILVKGRLYGTTTYGGADDDGTVFSIDIKTGAERIVYSFSGMPDGLDPQAGLIDVNGTFYGTTAAGGAHNYGTIFSLTPSGTERVLYSFAEPPDGQNPRADLTAINGKLFGTTAQGGAFTSGFGGTLFSFDPANGRESLLHSFGNGTDGAYPEASVVKLGRKLFGTAGIGGPYSSECVTSGDLGAGTAFSWRL